MTKGANQCYEGSCRKAIFAPLKIQLGGSCFVMSERKQIYLIRSFLSWEVRRDLEDSKAKFAGFQSKVHNKDTLPMAVSEHTYLVHVQYRHLLQESRRDEQDRRILISGRREKKNVLDLHLYFLISFVK